MTRRAAGVLVVCAVLGVSGCNKQKKTTEGKTYRPSSQGKPGGSSGGQSENQPLNSPADTANGKVLKASDLGTSDATRGQVVAEPGAPVEHDTQKPAPKSPPPNGR
jgi:hypothetical protein